MSNLLFQRPCSLQRPVGTLLPYRHLCHVCLRVCACTAQLSEFLPLPVLYRPTRSRCNDSAGRLSAPNYVAFSARQVYQRTTHSTSYILNQIHLSLLLKNIRSSTSSLCNESFRFIIFPSPFHLHLLLTARTTFSLCQLSICSSLILLPPKPMAQVASRNLATKTRLLCWMPLLDYQ